MYFKIKLINPSDTLESKRKHLQSLFPKAPLTYEGKTRNQGFLKKFASAIGYKKYLEFIHNDATVTEARIEDRNFKNPYFLLTESIVLENPYDNKEIATFYIHQETNKSEMTGESYHSFEIADKFINFLNKVLPNIEIQSEMVKEKPVIEKENVFFDLTLSADNNYPYTFDFFFHNPLSINEIKELYQFLEFINIDNYIITQHFCTCEFCNPQASNGGGRYMVTIEYDYDIAKMNKNKHKVVA